MPRSRLWLASVVLAAITLALPACRMSDLPLWKPAPTKPGEGWEVEQIRGVCYRDDPDADNFRHRLDIYVPKGAHDFPVVVLVHGGAWVIGNNRSFGLYASVGQHLASCGIGAVMPNYRLSPGAKHPEHVKDIARAFAWTHAHIAEYGGRPDQLFLAGHSAGGHLVSLLATDERFLNAEGLCTADVRGVVSISGVYRIPPEKDHFTLGGAGPRAVRLNEVAPLRGDNRTGPRTATCLPGVPFRLDVFRPAFADDPQVRADASPINHVRPGLPPFLLFFAENDFPGLADLASEFDQALLEQGGESRLVAVYARNHNSIMYNAVSQDDPVAREMVDFVWRHAANCDNAR
jgi:acetyl esterase/lipase